MDFCVPFSGEGSLSLSLSLSLDELLTMTIKQCFFVFFTPNQSMDRMKFQSTSSAHYKWTQ